MFQNSDIKAKHVFCSMQELVLLEALGALVAQDQLAVQEPLALLEVREGQEAQEVHSLDAKIIEHQKYWFDNCSFLK